MPGKLLCQSCAEAILRLLRIWMEDVQGSVAKGKRVPETGPGRLSGIRLSFENKIFTRAAAGGSS